MPQLLGVPILRSAECDVSRGSGEKFGQRSHQSNAHYINPIDSGPETELASDLPAYESRAQDFSVAEEIVADTSSQIIRVNDVEWTSMTPTIRAKMLWSDPATKRRAQLTRFDPGATLPMHRHVGDDLLYVIEGSIADEHGTTTTGNVGYRPNGCVHSVISKNGATVLAIVTGGIEPATDLAGAPASQNFNLSEI